jgi:type II secretory pathway predicted ATPase ExeA
MFQQFFGLEATPFTKAIGTANVLSTPGLKELSSRLAHVVRERGIGVVTGDIGSGKSTAVRAFVSSLDINRHVIIQLTAPIPTPGSLYRALLLALNLHQPFGAAAQIAALRTAFADLVQNRKTPVLVIDEAHLLPAVIIDPLRTLLAAELDSKSLATLILIGQPDLKRLLQSNSLQAFSQRITTRAHLDPLSPEVTLAYIQHHLTVAGCQNEFLFAEDALRRIADHTQGIPRRINQLATASLIAAAADKKKMVDDNSVRRAINDIDQD